MASPDHERIRVTDVPPEPRAVIPIERDVVTGLPVHFDHSDKSRQNSTQNQTSRPTQHRPTQQGAAQQRARHGRRLIRRGARGSAHTSAAGAGGVSLGVAVGGVVAAVAAVAVVTFVVARSTGGHTAVGAAASVAASSAPAGVSTSISTAPGVSSATVTTPKVPPSTPLAVSPAPNPAAGTASNSASAPTPSSRSASPSSSAATTPVDRSTGSSAALTGADAIGLDGTYALTWRVTAGTGPAGVAEVGKTGSVTWTAHRNCAADGCRTTVTGDFAPNPAGDASAWASRSTVESVVCREVKTLKATGGNWSERITTSASMTAHTGTAVTAGTITQHLEQLTLCPGQHDPIYSNTVEMTFHRTGD